MPTTWTSQIPTFNECDEIRLLKHSQTGENAQNMISPLPTMFSIVIATEIIICATIILSISANAFNVGHSKKSLTLYHTIPTFNDPV